MLRVVETMIGRFGSILPRFGAFHPSWIATDASIIISVFGVPGLIGRGGKLNLPAGGEYHTVFLKVVEEEVRIKLALYTIRILVPSVYSYR